MVKTNNARARLDADRTAVPLTSIVHHPPHGGCISPYMPLVNPEYVGADGERVPLSAVAAPPALTPSEVALAKMLAAYLEWYAADKGRYTDDDESVDHMGGALEDEGMLDYPKKGASEKGAALLDRARVMLKVGRRC